MLPYKYRFIISFVAVEMFFVIMIVGLNFYALNTTTRELAEEKMTASLLLGSQLAVIPISTLDVASLDMVNRQLGAIKGLVASYMSDINDIYLSGASHEMIQESKTALLASVVDVKNPRVLQKELSIDDVAVGKITLLFDTEDLEYTLDENRVRTLLLVLFEVIVSTLIALFVGNRLSGSIERLVDFSNRIAGEKKVSVAEYKFDGEFRILSDAMTQMQEKIVLRNEKLMMWGTIFESTREGIVVTDTKGVVLMVNPAFSAITGFSQDEVINQKIDLLKSGYHDRAFYRALWSALEHDGYWQGEIWNRKKDGHVIPEWMSINGIKNEQGITQQYVAVFSDISKIKESEERLHYLAHYDVLTALPNRLMLLQEMKRILEKAKEGHLKYAVIYMDIDDFKNINDSYGHSIGDRLIKKIAHLLSTIVLPSEILAKVGGDEFVTVIETLKAPGRLDAFIAAVYDAFRNTLEVDDYHFQINLSLGVAMYPDDATETEMLIRNADAALNRAKESGKNRVEYYRQELTSEIIKKMTLEKELHEAIRRQEFEIFFQPQIDVRTSTIVGMEALVRWKHPHHGYVAPDAFIPFAEKKGLIEEISKIVLTQSIQTLREWVERFDFQGYIAVNISGVEFQNMEFIRNIEALLKKYDVEPRQIELELTETFIMENAQSVAKQLKYLKEMGFKLAIDDFGTGYSSLNYLRMFPLSKLKIDKSFVSHLNDNPDDTAIIEAIIALARALQLEVIAEGVETVAQQKILEHFDCTLQQGYLYSKPVPKIKMEAMLASGEEEMP